MHSHSHKHDQSHNHQHFHSHDHGHDHLHQIASRNIGLAFFLNVSFVFIELVGGILTGSVAILADALHDLGDSFSLGLAWYLQKVSRRSADRYFSYGYGRFSLLSALISSIVILVGSSVILFETIPRFWSPQPVHGVGMLALAVLGILVNGIGSFILSRGKTLNENVLKWHLLEDVLGWAAIMVGALVIMWQGWLWIDPLLAIIVSIFIIKNVIKSLVQTVKLLLQSVPEEFDNEGFREQIRQLPHVHDVHDVHAWSLDGYRHVLSLHIVVNRSLTAEENCSLRAQVRTIADDLGHYQTTIEIEELGENCPADSKELKI